MILMKVKPGIDNLFERYHHVLDKKNIGLLVNQASINSSFVHSIILFKNARNCRLKAIFTPEHGLYGIKEYMDKVPSSHDTSLQLPVYSLYGNALSPSDDMLANIDTMIFDMQDVGSRYYTYAATMALCMQKCAQLHKDFIVLDRPNPLNGITVQGNILKPGFESFVGMFPLPVRHGMTMGELALYMKDHLHIELNLLIIPMRNWKRRFFWNDTNLYWIQPSPNMPQWSTAVFYPGTCLFEATNVSEGRGTTRPFELIGAPWIDLYEFCRDLNNLRIPCIHFLPMCFVPKFDKYTNENCGGVQICIEDPVADAYKAAIRIIAYLHDRYPDHFAWRQPPYEFNNHLMPFDLLTGTDSIRLAIENGNSPDNILKNEYKKLHYFKEKRKKYLLYQ